MPELISSVHNPRVKNLVRLREGTHRRRQKRFLIEGFREIERALSCKWPIETLFFCSDLFKHPDSFELLHEVESAGIEMVQLSGDPYSKCAYRQGPDGLLAVGIQKEWTLADLPLSENPLIVVLEAIEKPGNLGAIFRTANAAGAEAIILANPVTDPFNPNTIRASQGAFFQLPFCSTNNEDTFTFLEEKKINPILTSPAAERSLWEADLRAPTALVLGSEDEGLSTEWLENFNAYSLPMRGVSDSLNVASMSAVALFEAVRQRSSV